MHQQPGPHSRPEGVHERACGASGRRKKSGFKTDLRSNRTKEQRSSTIKEGAYTRELERVLTSIGLNHCFGDILGDRNGAYSEYSVDGDESRRTSKRLVEHAPLQMRFSFFQALVSMIAETAIPHPQKTEKNYTFAYIKEREGEREENVLVYHCMEQ